MPLAIELAAARVRALTLDEIVDSLHDRFRLLTGGARTAVRRQQTLRASVDWSHALLTEPERALFRRLAVFMGGFDLRRRPGGRGSRRSRAVSGPRSTQPACRQVASRRRKSPTVERDTAFWKPCASTHWRSSANQAKQTKYEYATATITQRWQRGWMLRARHDYEHLLAQAEIEIDNLRAAFIWSRENDDITKAVELASSLMPIWLARAAHRKGQAWLDAAGAESQVSEPAIWARAIADKAELGSWVDVSGMWEPVQQALAIARDIDDPALLIRALDGMRLHHHARSRVGAPVLHRGNRPRTGLGDSWRLSQILSRQATGGCWLATSSQWSRWPWKDATWRTPSATTSTRGSVVFSSRWPSCAMARQPLR